MLGNENRTAHIESILIETVRRGATRYIGKGTVIARPGVGVESGVAEIFDEVAMQIARAALGDEADLSGRGASVFGRIIGGKNLHLLYGIYV